MTYEKERIASYRKDAPPRPEDHFDGRPKIWTGIAHEGRDPLLDRLIEVHPDRRYEDFDFANARARNRV